MLSRVAWRLSGSCSTLRLSSTASMPHPMSTPTAAGMTAARVGTTDPTVAPTPKCTSGMAATCGPTHASFAVATSCSIASCATSCVHTRTGRAPLRSTVYMVFGPPAPCCDGGLPGLRPAHEWRRPLVGRLGPEVFSASDVFAAMVWRRSGPACLQAGQYRCCHGQEARLTTKRGGDDAYGLGRRGVCQARGWRPSEARTGAPYGLFEDASLRSSASTALVLWPVSALEADGRAERLGALRASLRGPVVVRSRLQSTGCRRWTRSSASRVDSRKNRGKGKSPVRLPSRRGSVLNPASKLSPLDSARRLADGTR